MDIFLKIKNSISFFLAIILAFFGIGFPDRGTKDTIEDGHVRIMSFNIRCAEFTERGRIVPQLIGEYMPDSVGLQECTYDWYNTLKILLPEYGFIGVGRDTGDKSKKCGEMSAVLYRTDKYTLIDSGTFWLSETPEKISYGWDGVCRRICTYVVLEDLKTGERYAHFNAHLDHVGKKAKNNGIRLVLEKASEYEIPTIITGDFNFARNTDYYKNIEESAFRNTQDIAVQTMDGRTYHGYRGGEDGVPIDYILVNSKIESVSRYKIVREKIDGIFTSDHYPIYADMKLVG